MMKLTNRTERKSISVFISLLLLSQSVLSSAESSLWSERSKISSEKLRDDARPPTGANGNFLLASLPVSHSTLALPFSSKALTDLGINLDLSREKKADLAARVIPNWLQKAVAPSATIHSIHFSKNKKPGAKTVLLVQDAHMHYEAQTNIAETIDALARALEPKKSKLLVGMEGAWVDTADFRAYNKIPFRAELRQAARAFTKLGALNGTELAAVGYQGDGTRGPVELPFAVTGIENRDMYEANVKALQAAWPSREKVKKALSELERELTELKRVHYTPALVELDAKKTGYANGAVPLTDYIIHLSSLRHAPSRNIDQLIEAALLEDSIDFKKVERERNRLLEALVAKISESEIQTLLKDSSLFKSGELSISGYYEHIKTLARRHGVDMAKYPEMTLYIRYVLQTEAIDQNQLITELNRYETEIQESLTRMVQ